MAMQPKHCGIAKKMALTVVNTQNVAHIERAEGKAVPLTLAQLRELKIPAPTASSCHKKYNPYAVTQKREKR